MRRVILILTLILMSLLAGCIEPEQTAEDSLVPYKQSLLPVFQGDVASLGEILRYCIAVRLDADALALTGRQQVLYAKLPVESHKLVPVEVSESHAGQGPVKALDRIISRHSIRESGSAS